MTQSPSDPYVSALREDWPSQGDVARIRRKLIGTGLGVSLALVSVSKTAAASPALVKTGLLANLSARFMNLSLISQFSVVTAATTVAITAPMWSTTERQAAPDLQSGTPSAVASRAERRYPVQLPARPMTAVPSAPAASLTPPSPSEPRNVLKFIGLARVDQRQPAPELSSLAEETRLLDAALGAIRAGELNRAVALLDEHEARFADAKLGRERQRARQKLDEARRRRVP